MILCRIGKCTPETELYSEQTANIVQGYPKRLNFMRRLHGIYTDFFLIFMIPCNYIHLILSMPNFWKNHLKSFLGRRLNVSLESSYLPSFKSSLQFHPFSFYVKSNKLCVKSAWKSFFWHLNTNRPLIHFPFCFPPFALWCFITNPVNPSLKGSVFLLLIRGYRTNFWIMGFT